MTHPNNSGVTASTAGASGKILIQDSASPAGVRWATPLEALELKVRRLQATLERARLDPGGYGTRWDLD